MKIQYDRKVIVFATVLAFTATQFLTAAAASQNLPQSQTNTATAGSVPQDSSSAENGSAASSGNGKLQRLDNQLDSIFTDTFRDFDRWFGPADLTSSIDLREQKDKYVVRVYVPDADTSKINAAVENNTLHVTAEGDQKNKGAEKSERYEQILSLPGPVRSDQMKVERKKNLIVIELPKTGGSVAAASPAGRANSNPNPHDLAMLDQSIIDRMTRMQGRMEQMFRDVFPQDLTNGFNSLQMSSAAKIDEQKDKYVARFYLPDRDLKDVNVELKDGELRLSAAENSSGQQKGFSTSESGRYEQILSLPGPVNDKGMKVERKNSTIVVTVPKA